MKKVIIVCMVFFVSSFLFSYEYIMNTNPTGIGSLTGNVQITTLSGGNWDDGYYDLAIPAANQFYYYGKLVTILRIFTNGIVHLVSGSSSFVSGTAGNFPIPYPGYNPYNFVAPLWSDYDLRTTGAIYYQIYNGASNNNYIIVEWRGVPHYGASSTAYSFSCAFCCSTNPYYANAIIFAYTDVDSGDATYDNGKSATVGMENSTGTLGEQYSYNEAIVTNGLKITFTPFEPIYGSTTDLDSYNADDGYPDAVIFRPSNGYWYTYNSNGGQTSYHWGAKGDVALPGDYDGDGDADECVFRPSNGHWYGHAPDFDIQWGTGGDIPVPADYNGDGSLDIAVFRPSNGYWYVYIRGTGTVYSWQFGQPGDIPLPADYDGDNYADMAVFRPATGTWYIRKTTDWSILEKQWGTEGDIPMPTNLFGDNFLIPTVFRPSNGTWYAINPYNNGIGSYVWGQDGDVPVPADENNGGSSDPVVFRPGNGYWYSYYTPTLLPSSFQWGTLGDKPRFRRSFLIVSPPPTSGGPDH